MNIELGTRFGRLVVQSAERKGRYYYCHCLCDCGKSKTARYDHIRMGGTASCGCLHAEKASARAGVMHRANTTHGAAGTRAHGIWFGMRQRCNNPKNPFFSYYGGRGIRVCERWQDFANFLADMGQPEPGYTLDRIDSDGNYEPANCRWATRKEQMNNRRCCVMITWRGETLNRRQWSERTGIHYNTIAQRQDRGLPLDQVFAPVKPRSMRETSS